MTSRVCPPEGGTVEVVGGHPSPCPPCGPSIWTRGGGAEPLPWRDALYLESASIFNLFTCHKEIQRSHALCHFRTSHTGG